MRVGAPCAREQALGWVRVSTCKRWQRSPGGRCLKIASRRRGRESPEEGMMVPQAANWAQCPGHAIAGGWTSPTSRWSHFLCSVSPKPSLATLRGTPAPWPACVPASQQWCDLGHDLAQWWELSLAPSLLPLLPPMFQVSWTGRMSSQGARWSHSPTTLCSLRCSQFPIWPYEHLPPSS